MHQRRHLVWHRGDLRLHDHAALAAATEAAAGAGALLGLVVLDPAILTPTSARRRAWFYANVAALRESYRERGGTLLVRRGKPWEVLPHVARSGSVQTVHAIASYTPYGRHRDERTDAALRSVGARLCWHGGNYLYEPGSVVKDDGGPYAVYTPFARRARRQPLPTPLPTPESLPAAPPELIAALGGEGEIPTEVSDVPLPPAGEDAALAALVDFSAAVLADYHRGRDRLDGSGSSRLSVYLTLGALSARVAAAVAHAHGGPGGEKFVAELLWRDFMAQLLHVHPRLLEEPFDRRWQALPWHHDEALFAAWCAGRTGVDAVDAAMRQLAATGWLSNRARMLAAQFLVKLARLPWQWGERYFKQQLLDGDTANNVGGWQWAGGLGVDAAPYFRIFNPDHQAAKHDPDGRWRARWLAGADDRPPAPLFDLAAARRQYLAEAKAVV